MKFLFQLWTGLFAVAFSLLVFDASANASLNQVGGWSANSDKIPTFTPGTAVVDHSGNAFVVDHGLGRVIRIGSDGEINLNWAKGAQGVSDVAADSDGDIYLLDKGNGNIHRFSPSGELLTTWSVAPYAATALAIEWESGSLWLLTTNKVVGYGPDGTLRSLAPDAFSFAALPEFISPIFTGDGAGHLVVASAEFDAGSVMKTIYRFNLDGTRISKWSQPAKVVRIENPKNTLTYMIGYRSLGVDSSGNIWVTTSDTDFNYKRVDASGLLLGGVGNPAEGGGIVDIDDQDRFWSTGLDPDSVVEPSDFVLRRRESDGTGVETWRQDDFPGYVDQIHPESFRHVRDFSIDPAGNVAMLDTSMRRVKIFDAAGVFQRLIPLPNGVGQADDPVGIELLGGGKIEVLDGTSQKLLKFDSSGSPAGEVALNLGGKVLAVQRTTDGGHLVLSEPGKVTRLDRFDSVSGSWNLGRRLTDERSTDIAQGADGRIYVAIPGAIEAYSPAGQHLANWTLGDHFCVGPGGGDLRLTTGPEGQLFAVASLDRYGLSNKLIALGEDLDQAWSDDINWEWGNQLEAAPDGSFLLAGSTGMIRVTRQDPEVAPSDEKCPPEPSGFRILGVSYGHSHSWARVRVRVPERGKLLISNQKLETRTKRVTGEGTFALNLKLKRRYNRPSRPRRQLKFRVEIRFIGSSFSVSRSVRVLLRGKLLTRSR